MAQRVHRGGWAGGNAGGGALGGIADRVIGLFGRIIWAVRRIAGVAGGAVGRRSKVGVIRVVLAITILLNAYYLIGWIPMHEISNQDDWAPASIPEGGSRGVSAMVELLDREVNENGWTPNDPFFMPSITMDNMPNFQMGILAGISRIAIEFRDRVGRTRGSAQEDPDLQRAAGLLQYPPTQWVFDWQTTTMVTATAEEQYRKAIEALQSYNQRISSGQAEFAVRSDTLQIMMDRIATDLGASSQLIDDQIEAGRDKFFDWDSDELYYRTKGQMYAYYIILREFTVDFEPVIQGAQSGPAWDQMVESMRRGAVLKPLSVLNAAPESWFFPSHLAVQGFYLLRARTQLQELVEILTRS